MNKPPMPYHGHCGGIHPEGVPAVLAEDLTIAYPGLTEIALASFNARIERGQRVALVGPNGAGKSTFLMAAAGLLQPEAGSIQVLGHAPDACRHQIAYLPQRSYLNWNFPIDVEHFVRMGRYVHLGWFKRPKNDDMELALEAIALLGLEKVRERPIARLSGGQQQRAMLARALVQEADIYMLDEPLNAVDQTTREIMETVLNTLDEEGKTVIIATHDLGRLESDYDDAIYLVEGKRVEAPPGSFHLN